jgi:hypothetical protein
MMYAMAAANIVLQPIGLHGHAFSEQTQGFFPRLDGFLVGNSTSLPSQPTCHSLESLFARKSLGA